MTRLVAIYNVLNEEKTIEKSIRSVLEYVDEVHVYDGSWAQYKDVHHSSTDNTAKIVRGMFADKVFWHPTRKTFATQWEKRTKSLSCLKNGDYFLWLDGDEIVTNPEKLRELNYGEFDVAWAWCISNLYQCPYLIPRVIRYENGMHYDGKHWWILNKKQDIVVTHHDISTDYVNIDTDIRIWNLRQTRIGDKRKEYNDWVKAQHAFEKERSDWLLKNTIDVSKLERHMTGYKINHNQIETLRECEDPEYTLFAAMSRTFKTLNGNHMAQRWFDHFDNMNFPNNTELIFVLDSKDVKLARSIKNKLLTSWGDKFCGIKFYFSNEAPAKEFQRGIDGRRRRILRNWHVALTEAKGDVLLCAEDDTLPDDIDAYIKLADFLKNNPDCGYIQGIEVCRWEIPCLWSFVIEDDDDGNPISIVTPEYLSGINECTAGGWYLCAMPIDIARKVELHPITYLGGDGNNSSEIGPDVRQGYDITKLGYKCYTDFDLKCQHIRSDKDLHPDTEDLVVYSRKNESDWNKELTEIKSSITSKVTM